MGQIFAMNGVIFVCPDYRNFPQVPNRFFLSSVKSGISMCSYVRRSLTLLPLLILSDILRGRQLCLVWFVM
jgi:hypothetical protein